MIVLLSAAPIWANPVLELNNSVNTADFQTTISGTITDDAGTPLGGANVVEKGTTNGTQSDFDGNFTITAATNAVLVISYVGFTTQEVSVDGQTSITITMAEDFSQLSEVVVTGYLAQTRGDLTGSVASVDMAEATKAPIVNAAEALEGRVTGVTVNNAGSPGAAPKVTIRGFGTSNNTNPLYIVDGVQTDNANILNSINPADIEQINVLKDGAAAIYGARASNGVVIITTKGGGYNQATPTISLDLYTGFSRAANPPDLLNAQQHADMVFQSLTNDGSPITHPQYDPGSTGTFTVPSALVGYVDPLTGGPATATVRPGGTNWLDAIGQDGWTHNVSFAVSNGNETGKYYLSANYLDREGIFINTGFEQGTTRLNSEFKLGRVTVGEHLGVSYSNTETGVFGGGEDGSPGAFGPVNEALRSSPLIPIRDDNGVLAGTASGGLGNSRSPYANLVRSKDNFNRRFRVFGDVYLNAEIIDGLNFKTVFSGSVENFDSRRFQALDPEHIEPLATNTLAEQNIQNFLWTWTNTLNYTKIFGDHNVNALIGIEAVEDGSKGKQISRNGFLFETPDFYLLN
ncbi:MAG: SusC/RagA family TonB-linked outer membrane protein, partial [Flavobacteriaceae bacterium]